MNPYVIAAGVLALLASGGAVANELDSSNEDPFNRWDSLIRKYSAQYGIPWRWMKAIMIIESNLGQAPSVAHGLLFPTEIDKSKSSDGKSWGLMQLTLATARQFEPGITEEDLNYPDTSVRLSAKYLSWIIKNYWPLSNREAVIRSYNGGPGFNKTLAGQRDTPAYYAKFKAALAQVMSAQPGDELET